MELPERGRDGKLTGMKDNVNGMDFAHAVAEIVKAIPCGKVLTYGDVAALAGKPSCARQVGQVLGCFGFWSSVPCHRVVNSQGRTAPHWPSQIERLRSEGVAFTKNGHVDMKAHRWNLNSVCET